MTTLKLEYPITLGTGETLTELTIRRAKARDIRKMTGKTESEQAISLLSALTGLVPEDIDELDIVDFKRAAEVLEQQQAGKSAEKA